MSVLTSPRNWPLEPPLAAVAVVAVLYLLGQRRRVTKRRPLAPRWRTACFYSGLLALVAAFDSPLAAYDDRLFSVHMTQHVLLMTVAPPLIVLGRPWLSIWQPLPLRFRRVVAKQLARGAWAAPLRRAARFLARPLPAWLLLNATLVAWHLPALYDATVRDAAVHDFEHALLLSTALLFWTQLIDSAPFHRRIGGAHRAVYATAALAVGWLLAIVLAFDPTPLYPAYAQLAHRPGGLSALADQRLGAGVLWVPASIAYVVAACAGIYAWLDPDGQRRPGRLASQH